MATLGTQDEKLCKNNGRALPGAKQKAAENQPSRDALNLTSATAKEQTRTDGNRFGGKGDHTRLSRKLPAHDQEPAIRLPTSTDGKKKKLRTMPD